MRMCKWCLHLVVSNKEEMSKTHVIKIDVTNKCTIKQNALKDLFRNLITNQMQLTYLLG